jgi:A/G-specific adenine glycosylase
MKASDHTETLQRMRRRLLAWYDANRRDLPWRAAPGREADPYHVWLSEIMLQQTTAAAVAPYFTRFIRRWPGVEDLAAAELDDVLRAWSGLGYYARARNLHACARVVSEVHRGEFPQAEEALKRLPGIGDYTAAAIAAIAFARPASPAGNRALGADADAGRAARRLCSSPDGSWCDHLQATAATVRSLSAAVGLRRPCLGRP